MKTERDAWLSGIFGYDVFKVVPPAEEAAGGGPVLTSDSVIAAARGGPALLYCKVPVGRVGLVAALCAAGFTVVDVNVTFERRPGRVSEPPAKGTAIVREISPSQREAVLEIAATCFVYSRFHQDPHVAESRAQESRRAWIENYIGKVRGEELLVSLTDGEPSGFLAVLATQVGGEAARVIDLIGVDQRRQGAGIGKFLVDFFTNDSVGKCTLLRVGTQVANVSSVRLYERCGYRLAEAAYVLHAHVRDGRLLR